MQRTESIQHLSERDFDILVVGGGITGVCIAHDAALRGFSVGLIERHDFGGFTSSASSKLLHGGIRYLPKGQVWKVRESGREQIIFQQLVPHLTSWVPFLIPTEKGNLTKGAFALKVAMRLYRLCHFGIARLGKDVSMRPGTGQFFSPAEVVSRVPLLKGLRKLSGARVLYESHMHSSERMTLAFVKTAVENNAAAANYVEAVSFLQDGDNNRVRVIGVQARDRLNNNEFTIKARLVINSSGPAVQVLNESISDLSLNKKINGFSRGVHLVTRQIESKYALALTTRKKSEGFVNRGGRHFFIIPWRSRSLIGTSDVPFEGGFDDVRVTADDVRNFLVDINEALPEIGLTKDDVYYAFTGIYPLIVKNVRSDTYQGTGEYQLIDHHRTNGVEGVITSLGAKYTTARKVAEKTINLAVQKLLAQVKPCQTISSQLLEGCIDDIEQFISTKQSQYEEQLSPESVAHLIRYHGTEIDRVVEMATDKGELLQPLTAATNTLRVEVLYAVRAEMAQTLDDVLFRRTGIGTIKRPDDELLQQVTALMAEELGWDEQQQEREKEQVMRRYSYEQT